MRRHYWSLLIAFCCICIVGGPLALAYEPVDYNETIEIPLATRAPESLRSAGAGLQIAAAIESRYGGSWRVHSWNPLADSPHYIYGGGARLASQVTDATQLERLARQVMTENPDIFRASQQELVLHATPHALGKWVAHFQQQYRGIDVWQGRALVAFADDGRLLLLGSDIHADIDLDVRPTLTLADAQQIASADVPFDETTDRVEADGDLLILPVDGGEDGTAYHLVYRVQVHTEDPLAIWVTYVDAHDGSIIWRYNDVHFMFEGTATSDVQPNTYCDGHSWEPARYLRLNVGGQVVYADIGGEWTAPGSGSAAVSSSLVSPYVVVNNYGGAEASYAGTVYEGTPLDLVWDNSNSRQDERDVFDAVNDMHVFFQDVAPEFTYASQSITAYVNRTDGYCPGNAWWNGTINFCAAGSGYANTGEIQGVVYHEHGHGIQDAILGWQGDQGLGEGNSDIHAMLYTQDPIVGRGFYQGNCTTGIRNADNNLIYPDDVIGQQIHYAGQVICGFHWDAMVELQSLFGRDPGTLMTATTWHYGRVLLQPTTQPDQVFATFFADDDDGNLDNGTPNYDVYAQAAENHNFPYPEVIVGVHITHAGHPYTGAPSGGYAIDCIAESLNAGEILPGTMMLHYSINGGGFVDVAMAASGEPDGYTGDIPNQAYGTTVTYYISGEDDQGNYGTSPRNAPVSLHYFQVGDEFFDDMEADTAWIAGALDDNASTGIWERGVPVGTEYNGHVIQIGYDHSDPGTACYVTGASGGTAGANDVDGGKTTLFSPLVDLTGATSAQVTYWKWYSNAWGNNVDDYWRVDLSNDAGSTWTSLEYTDVITTAWTEMTFDLLSYFPDPGVMQLRFVADDSGQGSLVEACIDDFTLVAVFGTVGVDDDELSVRLITDLAQNAPNPFNPRTEIKFSLEQAGAANLSVFDMRGRLVKTLIDGQLPAGANQVVWDGTTNEGSPVATGMYFYQLQTDNKTLKKRMMLIK